MHNRVESFEICRHDVACIFGDSFIGCGGIEERVLEKAGVEAAYLVTALHEIIAR